MKNNNLFEGLKNSLNKALEHSKGKIDLRSTEIVIEEPPRIRPKKVSEIRNKLMISQAAFAKIIGVSKKTIEAWESGKNTPNGPSRLILSLLDKDPDFIEKYGLVHIN
jgi:putative transcriptional regulator